MVAENTDGLDKKNFDLSSTDEVNHRGILISGLNALEQNHGLSRENIFLLIDQLPEHFADFTHLGQIIFEPETHYMIQRDGELMLAKESNVLATDKITRMVRGQTIWNSKLVNGDRLPSDGKQTITIYSAKNRTDEKPADVILYSTAHELGHTAYNAVDPNQGPAFWEYLDSANNTNQYIKPNNSRQLLSAFNVWKTLEESNLPRYIEYKPSFISEGKRVSEGGGYTATKDSELSIQEDFAIAHEYLLFSKDLEHQDPMRYDILSFFYQMLS